MPRLLFEKKGSAIWISHLDLMRLFQRAFKRAGLPLTHTHGFNPRPSVSIALPLSVGIESQCELLDFDLDGVQPSFEEIRSKLNDALVEGVSVLSVYDAGKKIRDLALLRCRIVLCYDNGVPLGALDRIRGLFLNESLIVQKKTKNGLQDQDIIPMIRTLDITREGDTKVALDALICCQNPALNPMQLPLAIGVYLPDLKPDFVCCCRLEVFDRNEEVFR